MKEGLIADLVSIAPDSGRVMVLGGDGFAAIKEVGVWRVGAATADDLKDNFFRMTDKRNAYKLAHEARTALRPEETK